MKKVGLPIFIVIFILFRCTGNENIRSVEQTRILMDTFVQITIYDQIRPKDELDQIIESAFDRMEEIDFITNNYNDSSFISMVNQIAGRATVRIDTVLQKLIFASNTISELSHGAFDITIEPVKRLWKFSTDHPQVPDEAKIKQLLKWVDYRLIDLTGNKITFKSPEVSIDLGAIAKGYAIDEAIRILEQHGIKDALVNAGGDLRAICSNLTRGKRRVWIKHPRNEDLLYGYFKMDTGSAATSGDYERYFIQDGIRYHHLLNPKTGYPARNCISVTIQTASATTADALATAVFVLGHEAGMTLINQMPGVEGVIIYNDNGNLNHIVSGGLKGKFKRH